MRIKIIIVVLSVLIIAGLLGGYFWFQTQKSSADTQKFLSLRPALILNDEQKKLYDELTQKLTNQPDDYKTLFNLARFKQDLQDLDSAIAIYEYLGEQKPQDVLIWNNLAGIYYDRGDYQKAEAEHLKILEITPKWYNSYEELQAIYQFHLKDKAASFEKILLRGLAEYPEMKLALTAKLAVYYDEILQDKARAIKYYEELVKKNYNVEVVGPRLQELKK